MGIFGLKENSTFYIKIKCVYIYRWYYQYAVTFLWIKDIYVNKIEIRWTNGVQQTIRFIWWQADVSLMTRKKICFNLVYSHQMCIYHASWWVQVMSIHSSTPYNPGPISLGCSIHQLHLCREVRPPHTHIPTTSVLDMTPNNLMVRLQKFWSFGKCDVRLLCHYS